MAKLAREEADRLRPTVDDRSLPTSTQHPSQAQYSSSIARRRSAVLLITVTGAALAFLIAILLGILVPPRTLADEMSKNRAPNDVVYDPLEFTHGFYPPEKLEDGTTYEWTGPQATLTFPFAANLGRNAHISVRLASDWAPGQQPATSSLLVNGKGVADFTTSKDFSTVEATVDTKAVPNPYLDPSHIQIDIESSTSRAQGDPRDLGVVVDWIRVEPERSRTEVFLEGLVWAFAVALVLFVATGRFGFAWGVVFGLGSLLTLVGLHLTYLPREITPAVEAALAGLGWVPAASLAPRRWPALGLPLAAAMIWMVTAGRVLGDWQMDDAYISYRYAWNLVHGNGLIYNVGEVVEGYTNFLWTLVAAAAIAAGQTPAAVTLALNIALSMGLLALTWHLAAKLSSGQYLWSLLAVALLVVDGSLLAYGARGSGMETILFSFLVLLSLALLWVED